MFVNNLLCSECSPLYTAPYVCVATCFGMAVLFLDKFVGYFITVH
jgi:hypothetical protein